MIAVALPLALMALAVQPSLESLYAESLQRTASSVSEAQRAQFGEVFRQLLDAESEPGLEGLAVVAAEGYRVLQQEAGGGGQGFYALRARGAALFLQAPHAAGDDLQTGEITFRLARELEPRALALSTTSRAEIDLARDGGSLFQEATLGFARHLRGKEPTVLQIHGFAQDKRRTEAGRNSDVILSSGHDTPGRAVQVLARCLRRDLDLQVGVFPDVPELGAQTNLQGQQLPQGSFVHVELSRDLRRDLARGEGIDALAACIREAVL